MARHHLARTGADPVEATRDLVALHSSDPLTPHLALWARVADYQPEALDRAIAEGDALWRLHAMRHTLWVACTGEVGVLDAAVGQDVARKERKRLVGWIEAQRSGAEAWLAELEQAVLGALSGQGTEPRTTRELGAEVPALGTKVMVGSGRWQSEVAIGSRLLFVLAMELKLARVAPAGSWRSSQYAWVPAPGTDRLDASEARARLVERYLARFGPVTETDVRWWTGLTAARVRKALAAIGAVEVAVEGGAAWDLPAEADAAPEGEGEGSVALLPGLDPTPMGYKERGWFLGEHEAALFDRNGNVGPTVWAGGRIVGGWAAGPHGVVVVRLLEEVAPAVARRIGEEAEALTAWLGGVSVTPRFRTPLEKELTG